jgi:low temperature requirement protein LtrA
VTRLRAAEQILSPDSLKNAARTFRLRTWATDKFIARLPAHGADRKVTWLELFFDLVFVAAVSQVAEPLRDHYTFGELTRFTPLFLLIWWAWTGRALFSTRFDTDDGVQRALTLVEMFAVAVMAANARESLASRSSAGFAAAYAAVRVILLIHYLRAISVREARGLTVSYLIGHGVAAVLWLVSSVVPDIATRLTLWLIACAIDLGTPAVALDHSVETPPHPAHLPERFGLFTLILLGESVVAVMKGIESQETWSLRAALSALLGISALFAAWWWYFDGIHATAEHSVRTRADAKRLHLWAYAHFPLYLSIVVIGVGIRRVVTSATKAELPASDLIMWSIGVTLLVLSMASIAATRSPHSRKRRAVHPSWSPSAAFSARDTRMK